MCRAAAGHAGWMRGGPGGEPAHRGPQGATPSACTPPWEQRRVLDHLTSPRDRPSVTSTPRGHPARAHRARRAHPARSEQRQPLAAVCTPRRNGPFHPPWGNQILLRVSGLLRPPIHTSGVFGVVCSSRYKRKSSKTAVGDMVSGSEGGVGVTMFL